MAEIIHDGFDWLASDAITRQRSLPKWDEGLPAVGNGAIAPIVANRGLHTTQGFTSAGGKWLEKGFGGNRSRLFCGFALHVLWADSSLPHVKALGSVFDGTDYQCTLTLETDWSVGLRRGDKDATLIAKTAANSISHGLAWEWFEFEFVIHGSTGVWRIWKEGTLLEAFTGLNTKTTGNASGTKYRLGANGTEAIYNFTLTDFYLIDDQAGDGPSDRVGDSAMYVDFPNGAGALTEFTPSAGSNWQNVDEAPHDTDATYNEADTPGQRDRYAFTPLPEDFNGTIISATYGYTMRKTDAGSRTTTAAARSGSSEVTDVTQTLTTDYQHFAMTIWEDPAGGDLTKEVVDAIQFGPEIVA